ncbi:MAG TPA: aldehyde dehydrogenase [Microbacterium sp.]|uniref:aldehyde dehydrogenase n=1 Tax=Microbacterium sp. TaxID=51671 RepID=UPI002B4A5E0D|nr:aldehyde dehydrogenase [Microbacterium sp.]HKT58165.1 aldehyde dehydrogenase [Microbacterium sp.]
MSTSEVPRQTHLIAGQWRPSANAATFERTNPYTGDVVTVASAAERADVAAAIDAAAVAFPEWSAASSRYRSELLEAAADLLAERAVEIAGIMTEECGATFGWGMFNCQLAAGMLRAAAGLTDAAEKAEETIPSGVPGLDAKAVRRPAGVVSAMAPWNAPVILATRAVAAPLAFGNTVVLKASEKCPRVHAAVAAVLHDAGLPAGVINFVVHSAEGAPDVVDELIAHPAVRRVNFTGSTRVGRIIAAKCAEHLKPSVLELGGKAPMIVLDDADLDLTASAATFGAFMNSGQICMSTERIIVEPGIADAFQARLVDRARALVTGDPSDQGTMIGPVVDDASRRHVLDLIEDARSQGAEVLAGGEDLGHNVLSPAVVAHVTPEMRLYSEESFGPIVALIDARDTDDAVRIANDSDYGLSAAIFTTDHDRGLALAGRVESGICHINGATVHDEPQMPFGGVKDSGWGRFGGTAALHEFTDLRWVTVQSGERHYPI